MSCATNCPNTGQPAGLLPSSSTSLPSEAAPSAPSPSKRLFSTSSGASSGNIRPYRPSKATKGAPTGRAGARQKSRAARTGPVCRRRADGVPVDVPALRSRLDRHDEDVGEREESGQRPEHVPAARELPVAVRDVDLLAECANKSGLLYLHRHENGQPYRPRRREEAKAESQPRRPGDPAPVIGEGKAGDGDHRCTSGGESEVSQCHKPLRIGDDPRVASPVGKSLR